MIGAIVTVSHYQGGKYDRGKYDRSKCDRGNYDRDAAVGSHALILGRVLHESP